MRYQQDCHTIELSVRELCALAHQSGSLEFGSPRQRIEAMRRGGELHRKMQAKEKNYTAEVFLRNTVSFHGIFYTVEGRADGVIEENGELTVEEIKTTRGTGFSVGARGDAYSQLRCYAHFLAQKNHLSKIHLRMRVVHSDTGEIKDHCSVATADELYAFYLSLLERIEPYAREEIARREDRIPTARSIGFPYQHPREGQTEMAQSTFRAIRKGQRLFAQAPTGIGKTMSALYPAVKALGEGLCDRIFYLTAKASTRREAFAAAGKLFAAGAILRTVTLHAKEQMCLREGGCRSGGVSRCNSKDCPYAKGYYDRSRDAIWALLSANHGFTASLITQAGKQHRVCPYELSLDLSEYCEIIICDYNYAFDPAVYLRRYFDANEGERGEYVFLVDEAHNLPDRARDMYSMRLSAQPFEAVYARVEPDADPLLEEALGGFLIAMRRLAGLCTENRQKNENGTENGYYLNRKPLMNFLETVSKTKGKLERFQKKNPGHGLTEAITELVSLLRQFLSLSECYDDRFLTYIEMLESRVTVQIFCLDPAGVLNVAMGRARAAVFFSATMAPLDYFSDILGGGKGAKMIDLPSPYDPARLCVTVASSVSTRMEDRDKSYRRIATLIAATVSAKAGNYLVYFPSYDYMEKVLEQFLDKYPQVPHVVQQRQMRAKDREEFLRYFKEDEGQLRVGFCVLGGSFSEGVDLPGSRLIGAIVVGVGIPGLSNERNILRDYYESKCESGYDYAYTFPGMNRVLQAAGRVIRREEDKGVVVLIDSRYAEEPYLHLYPKHWQGMMAASTPSALAQRLRLFWQEEEKNKK
ncbi:MAG: ATP-dependent DNA helicase [Ruminococcaceae bacterium]|nr:ATP-dependent DNA helicase [Oscillospiraceae bacterium]